MSEIFTEQVFCPKCGKESQITLMRSLNAQLDPDGAQALMDGSLFLFTCEGCGEVSKLDYELLYHDMEHMVMVHYVQEKNVEETRQMLANMDGMPGIDLSGYRQRIVTSQAALREKALIFHMGLDDRIIECIKLMFFAQASERFPDARVQSVYFYAEGDKYMLDFVADTPLSAELPTGLYEDLAANYGEAFDRDGEAFTVDLHWAAEFLRKLD